MRVMVVPCSLSVGGSEINAVDLAAAVQDRGHEVVLFGRPGPLEEVARRKGLRVVTDRSPDRLRPSPLAVAAMARAVGVERPDLVHSYEAYSTTEAFYAATVRYRVPVVGTIYAMSVDDYVPRSLPAIAGTSELEERLVVHRSRELVSRLDPPVDDAANRPDADAGQRFRQQSGIGEEEQLVVIVSRLDVWLKIDSLSDTVDAAGLLARTRPVRLLVVGDGPARPTLQMRADAVNAAAGREVVRLTGTMVDPVPAYQAADVVVGMGTSILRGMAAGRPAVVVGEQGFVRPVEPASEHVFLQQGFWGVGDGHGGAEQLATVVAGLLDEAPDQRADRERYVRTFVVERFGLDASADRLLAIYDDVRARHVRRWPAIADVVQTPHRVLVHKLRDRAPGRRAALKRRLTDNSPNAGYESALATRPVHQR